LNEGVLVELGLDWSCRNRPSETAVHNVLPQWTDLVAKPKTMFVGGPVKRDAAL